MIAIKRSCLDRSELHLVLNGGFPATEFESVLSHLDDCEQCRSAMEKLERDGDWLRESLAAEDADPLQSETACQVALWRMMQSPAISETATGSVPTEKLGPYRLLRALGAGGMGTVYLCEHERLKRRCAVKLLPRERVDQPGWLDRFDREMTTVASLEHPNIVRATDAGHQDGWHYLVMEHLDGMDVGRLASRMGQLDVADACEIVRQASLGLAHVHASGLVHRDVKPSNLMLTREGVVKLLDLGLVLSGDDPLAVDDRLTTVGHLMGTMPYMAPEQLLDSRDVDRRADIYSLGSTLFRLIAGKPPHARGGGLANHVVAITQQDAPRLDSVRQDVDHDVVDLVAEMLSRNPEKRPQEMVSVAQRLEAIGQQSQLKPLLRAALRRSSDEQSVSLLQTATSGQPPTNHSGRGPLWFGAMGAFLLLAGFLFKIATDRGELVIKSDQDGLVVAVKRGEELVERLEIVAGDDNKLTLHKGTYIIEIEGAGDQFSLSKNVITIDRGGSEPVEVQRKVKTAQANGDSVSASGTHSPMTLLYQGQDLAKWQEILVREQDPAALGHAMRAVEALTRGSEQRLEAATATLKTARKWGGIVSAGSNPTESDDPSHRYMAYLLEVFPKYFPEAGLRAIDVELGVGTRQSRTAAIWLLNNALPDLPMAGFSSGLDKQWLEQWSRQEGSEVLRSIFKNLEIAVADLSGDATMKPQTELGVTVALKLRSTTDGPIAGQSWLEEIVAERIHTAEKLWRETQANPHSLIQGHQFVVSEDTLAAAVELHQADRLKLNWDFVADILLGHNYLYRTTQSDRIVEALAHHAPELFLKAIESRLKELQTLSVPEMVKGTPYTGSFDYRGFGGGGFGGGGFGGPQTSWLPIFALCQKNSIWPMSLKFYAEHSQDPGTSLELLLRLRDVLTDGGVTVDHPEKPLEAIDAAIDTLRNKVSDDQSALQKAIGEAFSDQPKGDD